MRASAFALILAVYASIPAAAQSCSSGQTTLSGTIYAPNGQDPLPNVLVFIPGTTPGPLSGGISCPVPGQLPPGAPVVAGAMTGTDGTFKITIADGSLASLANVPLVAQSGKWRRQAVVASVTACQDNPVDPATIRMPQNQGEGDIPKIAIATGASDQVECVLRKVGINDSEFTDPSGSGRINLYKASGNPGAQISISTPSADTLMSNQTVLNSYDVLMLPCEGGAYTKNATQLSDLITYANGGGRVYASHFSYDWMYRNGAFATVANWAGNSTTLQNGNATIDITFAGGKTLADWLQLIGATSTKGQIALSTLRQDQTGVVAPTQSWMKLNSSGTTMQFTFNAPVGAANQCGRILFDEYHVENPITSPTGKNFPAECPSGTMTPQEKLMEYTLFDLTGSGGAPTMTPDSAAFGNQPVHFASTPQTFVWTNNAIFPIQVTSITGSGDFTVLNNSCGSSVAAGASCNINVVFTPTALGAETGTLTVVSASNTLTSTLTGTGIPDLTASAGSSSGLDFGKLDVTTTSAAQTIVWTNRGLGAVAVPPISITGDYAMTGTTCGASLSAGGSCSISIIFKPTAVGIRAGTVTTSSADPAYSGLSTALTGLGIDFIITTLPNSGSVIAGRGISAAVNLIPSTGYSNNITITCPAAATGTACGLTNDYIALSAATSVTMSISTTSHYTVIGYGGMGGHVGWMWFAAAGSWLLLWFGRKRAHIVVRLTLFVLMLTAGSLTLGGCSGHLPDTIAGYTPPGTYTYTVTATDGIVTHSATYTLTVTVN